MYDFFRSRNMAEHLNDSRSNEAHSEDETNFRPSSDSNSESFGNLLKGLLASSIETQKILQNQQQIMQNLVTLSTNKNAQNEEQAPLPQPIQ